MALCPSSVVRRPSVVGVAIISEPIGQISFKFQCSPWATAPDVFLIFEKKKAFSNFSRLLLFYICGTFDL